MSWNLVRWLWLLESPLYIGTTPAGSLNRCRLYVPGRALWGAVTAELARQGASVFPDYERVGMTVQGTMRFSYLYPAERHGASWPAWLPRYVTEKGLVWRREDDRDGGHELTDREMRMRVIITRAGTAIDPVSDTAAEGSLRETECVASVWRHTGAPVFLKGYVFLGREAPDLGGISRMFLGGDTRYGLGRLSRLNDTEPAREVFGAQVRLDADEPVIISSQLLAHAVPSRLAGRVMGHQEVLSGWIRGEGIHLRPIENTPLWVPGSLLRDDSAAAWRVKQQGVWHLEEEPCEEAGSA